MQYTRQLIFTKSDEILCKENQCEPYKIKTLMFDFKDCQNPLYAQTEIEYNSEARLIHYYSISE